jgi:Cu2+-exporting ATPase
MKTSTVEVGELVSSLSAAGVQRQIAALPGVHHVDVNYVAGSATVHYDETKTSLEDIRRRIVECGYHCRGEMLPAHVCPPEGHAEHAGHEGAWRPRRACRSWARRRTSPRRRLP